MFGSTGSEEIFGNVRLFNAQAAAVVNNVELDGNASPHSLESQNDDVYTRTRTKKQATGVGHTNHTVQAVACNLL